MPRRLYAVRDDDRRNSPCDISATSTRRSVFTRIRAWSSSGGCEDRLVPSFRFSSHGTTGGITHMRTLVRRTLAIGAVTACAVITGGVVRSAQQTGPSTPVALRPAVAAGRRHHITAERRRLRRRLPHGRHSRRPRGVRQRRRHVHAADEPRARQHGRRHPRPRRQGRVRLKWVINKETLQSSSGSDLMQRRSACGMR